MKSLSTSLIYLARAGYAARGVVYMIVGFFALMAAWGGSEQKGTKGALESLLGQPFGQILIWIVIVGIAGYVIWRLVQSIADADDHGTDLKGLVIRAGLLISALTYTGLAIYAISLVTSSGFSSGGSSSGSSGSLAQSMAGIVGHSAVAVLIALVLFGVAIAHVLKAKDEKFKKHFRPDAAGSQKVDLISKTGLYARGAVLAVIGFLFLTRGIQGGNQGSQPGLKEALEYIQNLPLGSWLLAATGLGLIAFALYSFIEAWAREVEMRDAV